MNMIYSFQVFDTVYVLTNGGPGSATEVLGTYSYKTAFGPARDQGYGAAIGIVIFLLTMAFTLIQWKTNNFDGQTKWRRRIPTVPLARQHDVRSATPAREVVDH